MQFSFNKKTFLAVIAVLSVSWLSLNYFVFTQNNLLYFHPDFKAFLDWSWQGKHERFHMTFGNYMPFYPYVCYLYTLCFENYEQMLASSFLLKGLIILFDAFTYAFIISIIKVKNIKTVVVLTVITIFNISIIYNSAFWGQVDGIHSMFVLLTFYFTVKRKWALVGLFFTLAFFTKIVSIIFLPVFSLFILNEVLCKRFHKREFVSIMAVMVCTSLTLSLPIILSGNLQGVWTTHKGFITAYHTVSGNAHNVWVLLTNNVDLMNTEDSSYIFQDISYRTIGLIMFIAFYAVAVWPLFQKLLKNLKNGTKDPIKTEALLYACILVPLIFFYFSTKIRERYAHPYLVFITLYCFYYRRYLFWFVATSIYFLQLESVLQYTKTLPQVFSNFHNKTSIYSPQLISGLFLALIIYLLHLSYLKENEQSLKELNSQFFKNRT
jgi:Gpi18-like mannosyltransferase